jgi:hypothetical protein
MLPSTPSFASVVAGRERRRLIPPEAGRGLEILGHAIDYLMDEYPRHGGRFDIGDDELQAAEILMALNREIFFSCPVVPTMGERWTAFWGRNRARLARSLPGLLNPES